MKILVLYHSNVLENRPGADNHIYTTSRMLSLKNEVTLVTWGKGAPITEVEGKLKIIHLGIGSDGSPSNSSSKIPSFLLELFSYLGINYILFLRNKGPNYGDFYDSAGTNYDVVIRIAFNKNKIPYFLNKNFHIPVVELAIVSGLPHYVDNLKEWMSFIEHPSVFQFKFSKHIFIQPSLS